MSSLDVALEFVRRINHHDVGSLCELMTDDHAFIDSMGLVEQGREKLRRGWEQYYRMFPDFSIVVERTFVEGSTVVLLGRCSGTFQSKKRWEVPAAWRAEVRDGRMAHWQIYADNTPVFALMEKA
jgi:ketosteroid isomerase-like protein